MEGARAKRRLSGSGDGGWGEGWEQMTLLALLDVVGKTVVCALLFSADAALVGAGAEGDEGTKEFV